MEILRNLSSLVLASVLALSPDSGPLLAQTGPDRQDVGPSITTELHCTAPDPATGDQVDRIMMIVRAWNLASLYQSDLRIYLSDQTKGTDYEWVGGGMGGSLSSYFYSREKNAGDPDVNTVIPLRPGHRIGVKVTYGPEWWSSPSDGEETLLSETAVNLDCPNVPAEDPRV